MSKFTKLLESNELIIFDGGYGTLLQSRGMPAGISPELYGMQSPEVVSSVHRDYADAGAMVLTTNTFGGSGFKLGLGQDVVAVNREMASIARQVAGDNILVGGSVGPTGKFIEPLGEVTFKEMVKVFMEQIKGLVQGGVDFILGETHFDLAETKALVIAAHQVCDLPVAVSMTFESPTASLTGTSPLTFIDTMQNLGVDMVGTNCSSGPEGLLEVVGNMLPRLDVPVFAEPNAGLPELDENNNTVFRLAPDDFAEQTVKFVAAGAKGVGGCCGTTPDHNQGAQGGLPGQDLDQAGTRGRTPSGAYQPGDKRSGGSQFPQPGYRRADQPYRQAGPYRPIAAGRI